jgi:cell division septal protein FtsQ
MSFRSRGGSTASRAPWPEGLERTEPLQGRTWTRPERPQRRRDAAVGWRALAVVVAGLEIGLLVWLGFGQALELRSIQVTGTHHMTAAQVARAAGLSSGSSVLSVDGVAAEQRLLDQVWIRTATVQPQLPGTVVIHVTEWQPVAAYHAGASTRLFLLSDQSVILGPTSSAGTMIVIQGPAGSDPRAGDRPLDPQLLTALVNIQRDLPSLIGQQVSGFVFDSCGDLTMLAKRGWKVYFGRVLTPEEFASLRDKLAALKAISGNGNVDYSSTDLEYVNVMNPSEPAVGLKSREPAPVSPSPGAAPAASPSPSPCK